MGCSKIFDQIKKLVIENKKLQKDIPVIIDEGLSVSRLSNIIHHNIEAISWKFIQKPM